jgi:hypothetical protein
MKLFDTSKEEAKRTARKVFQDAMRVGSFVMTVTMKDGNGGLRHETIRVDMHPGNLKESLKHIKRSYYNMGMRATDEERMCVPGGEGEQGLVPVQPVRPLPTANVPTRRTLLQGVSEDAATDRP